MTKHYFFDLDKTLTASRSPMTPSHQEVFATLCSAHDVAVVTGGTIEQIREQVTPRFDGRYYILAQSGNHALDKDGSILWEEALTTEQVATIMRFIELLKSHFNVTVRDENDIIENRGAQVAYSVLGFHENIEKKYSFDPDERKRREALAKHSSEIKALREAGVDVVPAGTTNFSFIPAGKHKGFNVDRFRTHEGWQKEECLYVGDALFPGGNDESVLGIIPTHAVKDPDDTFFFIKDMLS